MEVFLVGGAVRDQILKRPVTEQDWVVVGATPDEMLALGYRAVGQDFPVFLHPDTHEEYALARTERKTGPGYKGFDCYSAPEVTLEEDLKRRDFTVNAMALGHDHEVIDPFGGQRDCEAKVLRHVSVAFSEDPVRILRAARFCSQLPGFQVAEETLRLMKEMVQAGETDHLVKERVWQECAKAMDSAAPWRFFEVLSAVGLMPALSNGLTPDLADLRVATQQSHAGMVRWASCWFRAGGDAVKALSEAWRAPKVYADLSEMLARHWAPLQSKHDAEKVLDTLQQCDAFRRPQRFKTLLIAAQAVTKNGEVGALQSFWESALDALKDCIVDFSGCEEGVDIKEKIHATRKACLEAFLKDRHGAG